MLIIYKYPVHSEPFTLQLPVGARILTVQTQRNQPQIWALVDQDAKTETRGFVAIPTGLPFNDYNRRLDYIGTFQLEGGALVFHLFEAFDNLELERPEPSATRAQ